MLHGLKIEDNRITAHICKDENPYIISTHDALCFEVTFVAANDEVENILEVESVVTEQERVDWDNADISKYQSILIQSVPG